MHYTVKELQNLGVQCKGTDNIQISKSVNIYNPQNLILHDNIRIDDYTILSCKGIIEIYDYVRISSHCLLTCETKITIEKYCNISSGVKMYGGINNTNNSITNPLIPSKYSEMEYGSIVMQKHSVIGANSIIYPNIIISEGTTIQPLSLVNIKTEPWKIYAVNTIKFIKNRKNDQKTINNLDNEIFFDELYNEELKNMELENKKESVNKETKEINIDQNSILMNKHENSENKNNEKLNILITGGSKGIGRNIAINFLNEGHNVIVTYYKSYEEALELKKIGINIYQLNVTDTEECKIILQKIIDDFSKIDVLINSAGILKNELFHKMSYEIWYDVINTNLISIYNITHPIINNMLQHHKGKIINISSICGLKGSKGQSNYCASKFGIIGFTKTLALEYGRNNIQTNCICPGLVNTDMIKQIDNKVLNKILDSIPVNELIEPDEIFDICKLLINSKHSNGTIFNIDGGMLC